MSLARGSNVESVLCAGEHISNFAHNHVQLLLDLFQYCFCIQDIDGNSMMQRRNMKTYLRAFPHKYQVIP